jgi:hypothetical protein
MPKPNKEVVVEEEVGETQSDFDMSSATAEISSELFGQDDKEEDKDKDEGASPREDGSAAPAEGEENKSSDVASIEAAETPPQQTAEEGGDQSTAGGDNSAEVQAIGAPDTWSKEELATWATIPKEVQTALAPILARREEDFLRGITQYKGAAELGQKYDAVVEPYKPILAAENIDPVQMFQSFAGNHYILTRGTPEQKVELAAAMLNGYKIPLADLLNHIADSDIIPEAEDPRVTALRKEVDDLKRGYNERTNSERAATAERVSQEIEAFAADPAHPHFNEVADHISKLFETGMAKTLPEAYEMAVYANPVTRQKEIDRLTAERTSAAQTEEQKRKDKKTKSTADHVTLTPKSRDGTVPLGSIDDTLQATLAEIESRG